MLKLKPAKLPEPLLNLPQPPSRLFVSREGLDEIMGRPRLAIIGSRKATTYGRAVTSKFAAELAKQGVVIVSGLALGVDSIAHASALEAGGLTVAVLPAGLDKIYPRSHHQLAQRIIQADGLLVSEYPPNTEPRRENFIARNRIIAALSEGVLITEAAQNSGSLHTARFALELGLPVLCVPGPITSNLSAGTNNLIKAGATPVTSAEDVVNALNWKLEELPAREITAATEPERIILELIHSGISDGHDILDQSGLEAAAFNQALTMLEITGRIRPLGNNHWALS